MRIIRSLMFVVCSFGVLWVPVAHAQITAEIRAKIPFSFYVQETKLPAGTYLLKMMDNTDLNVMQIESADYEFSVMFPVDAAQLSNAPANTELMFHQYGNDEYLSRIFEKGNPDGDRVVLTHHESEMQKTETTSQEHSVPAERHGG